MDWKSLRNKAFVVIVVATMIGTLLFAPMFARMQAEYISLAASSSFEVSDRPDAAQTIYELPQMVVGWIGENDGVVIALATIVIMIFNGTLWRTTRAQYWATVAQQRAAVFCKADMSGVGVNASNGAIIVRFIIHKWTNSGSTQTKNMFMHVNLELRSTPLPDNFDFPDHPGSENVRVVLGPGAEIGGDPLPVQLPGLVDVVSGALFLYTWGWAEYDDVFPGSKRHRTEFCFRWIASGNPADQTQFSARWVLHGKHNGTDDECLKPLQTTGRS